MTRADADRFASDDIVGRRFAAIERDEFLRIHFLLCDGHHGSFSGDVRS